MCKGRKPPFKDIRAVVGLSSEGTNRGTHDNNRYLVVCYANNVLRTFQSPSLLRRQLPLHKGATALHQQHLNIQSDFAPQNPHHFTFERKQNYFLTENLKMVVLSYFLPASIVHCGNSGILGVLG